MLSIPIYIPLGPKNSLNAEAYYIGEPPQLFEPGMHTFDIYSDGGYLAWEVRTDDCAEPSISPSTFSEPPFCEGIGAPARPVSTPGSAPSMDEPRDWGVKLFPNPANTAVWLQAWKAEGPITVEIYNSLGRMLSSRSFSEPGSDKLPFDVSNYPPGLLLFKVNYGAESQVLRLLKE